MIAAALIVALLGASDADLVVHAQLPAEETGTMHYAESLRIEVGSAEPLIIDEAPVPLPGPHFRLPGGRFLLLGWSSPGVGMQSMHALLISVRDHAVRLDRQMTISTDRGSSGLLLRFADDRHVRIGIAEPEGWSGSDQAMWFLNLGDGASLDFAAMQRLRFERVVHQKTDRFYDGSRPPKRAPKRVAWIDITPDGFALAKK